MDELCVCTHPAELHVTSGNHIEGCSIPQCPCQYFDTPTDIHLYFELTYSNYLVLHRSILQSMPLDWQYQMVRLLEQADRKVVKARLPVPERWRCQPIDDNGRFAKDPIPHYNRGRTNVFGDDDE